MIDFRYHVVSIVAVFLALALGLFLGSTTLQDAVVHSLKNNTDRVTRENKSLDAQVSALEAHARLATDFDKELLPYAVSGRLNGQQITVVSAPGASDSVRKQLFTTLQEAGATVTADIRLQSSLMDPKQGAFLRSLSQHLNVAGDPAQPTADGAALAVGQLAAVLGQRPAARDVTPATIDTVLSTYKAAKVVSVANTTPTTRPGTLAVVLAGPAPSTGADPAATTAEHTVLVEMLRDLDVTAAGAVLAAPVPTPGSGPDVLSFAANANGLIHAAATVTGIDTPQGLIATVFALAAQLDGVSGQYGLRPGEPLPSASSTP